MVQASAYIEKQEFVKEISVIDLIPTLVNCLGLTAMLLASFGTTKPTQGVCFESPWEIILKNREIHLKNVKSQESRSKKLLAWPTNQRQTRTVERLKIV